MSAPGFWRGVAVALALSVVGAVVYTALAPVLGSGVVLRYLVAGLGAAYLALLLRELGARIGRVVVVAGWLAVTFALVAFDPSIWVWLLAQATLIWLVRSLYRYDGLPSAFADAALSAFAVMAAIATAAYTRSAFLTLWSFFLVQALYVLIGAGRDSRQADADGADAFGEAHRSAETALRRLSIRAR
jgi:hypothetical protein